MKIYLYLTDRIITFSLPKEISGSFSFDENPDKESKLINIEARDNAWVIYSTSDVSIVNGNDIIPSTKLLPNNFYILRKDNNNHIIYVSNLSFDNMLVYNYKKDLNLIIGNSKNSNIQYNCPFLNDLIITISYNEDKLILRKNKSINGVYIDNKSLINNEHYINIGEQINVYSLKIIFLNGMLLINNPGKKIVILEQSANIKQYNFPVQSELQEVEIKDLDLYSQKDYFYKSPRIRRFIETKEIKLIPPPSPEKGQELPVILTIGPMLTMGATSAIMIIDTLSKINTGQTTFKQSGTSLMSSGVMLISMILWPTITQYYNKRIKRKTRKDVADRYNKYLEEKRKELEIEMKRQKEILIENMSTLEECLEIIKKRDIKFWSKRNDQNDFMVARIGIGNQPLDIKIEYQEEELKLIDDELREKADNIIKDFEYIENVPIGYSFFENISTAIMGDINKGIIFINNIILQLITFYSYEEIKLVVFTNEKNKERWEYIKYLNHNFANDRNFRFFASNINSLKEVVEYLDNEFDNRINTTNSDENQEKKIHKPHYLIIIDDYERVKKYELINKISESDTNLGFSTLILEERLSKLPSKCNAFISLGTTQSGILKNHSNGQEQILFKDEIKGNINMMNVAKVISNIPIELEEDLKSLPDSIAFLEMERVGKVEQLNILNRWNNNNSTISLKTEIGVDESGDLMYLDLHEKYHGPHGLIAGTTGSGKSEFIITYILSLSMNYSPDDVAFILIDYKGGGLALAFENKTTGMRLPHLAGTITNLDKAEMDRTLVSIDSEIKRRQHMFNEAKEKVEESTMDIYKYQRHFKEGHLSEPIPHLFIICDEFAELKSQQPEFMDNLISVARIGRSLGVHLILATQKPSGVVNDQIWSNTKFRVCLKVQDQSDSNEMLKRPEAASIKQTGRFYLQVGYDELFLLGQSAWCGAKYYPSDVIVKQVDKSLNFINDNGNTIKKTEKVNEIKIEAKGEQLASIMKNIIEIANTTNKKARKLWLDNIPGFILIDELEKKYNITNQPYVVKSIIGEYDAPEKQEQGIIEHNYIEKGNTAVYGVNSSENEMFLNGLIYSTTKNHTAEEVNFYIIDYGSESLNKYSKLPQVGGVVLAEEKEEYNNLIKLITEETNYRKKLFAEYGGEYESYIKSNNKKLPLKVVIINNFNSLYEAIPETYDTFPELLRDSVRYGIIYIITGNGINSIPGKISINIQSIYTFKLKDQSDYNYIYNSRSKTVPRNIEGRGIIYNDGLHEFQMASITSEDNLNDYITTFINNQINTNTITAKKIPVLPEIVRVENIKEKISTIKSVPIGIIKNNLEIQTINFSENIGSSILANKLLNTEKFVKSLLSIFRIIPNLNLMIIDLTKSLNLDKKYYPNYYTENIEEILGKINDYLQKLIDEKSEVNGIILINGLDKFISSIEKIEIFKDFCGKIKKYEKIHVIYVEEPKKVKQYLYEKWYDEMFKGKAGVWVGKGLAEQSILETSSYSKEHQLKYKNDMGFYVSEGEATLLKLIDFISVEGEEDEE